MTKFGRGLNREVVAAVNRGEIEEPFSVQAVRDLVARRGWPVRENHLLVTLANAASDEHSPTYRKYFVASRRGHYRLRDAYRGADWR